MIERGLLVTIALLFMSPSVYGQTFIGISSGFHIPGAQDQKFKRFGTNGKLEETYLAKDVDGHITTFNAVFIDMVFHKQKRNKTGIRLEIVSWEFTSFADNFSPGSIPLSGSVQQDRSGLFCTLMRYYSIGKFKESALVKTIQYFIGAGMGIIDTDNDPGRYIRSPGFQLVNGLRTSLNKKVYASFEIRYLLSKDADNYSSKAGWAVDTSGTPTIFRFHPHFDTRFFIGQIGLSYQL